jgi:hypothetical protein
MKFSALLVIGVLLLSVAGPSVVSVVDAQLGSNSRAAPGTVIDQHSGQYIPPPANTELVECFYFFRYFFLFFIYIF